MDRKCVKWTMPGGEVANFTIWTLDNLREGYSVITATPSQNYLRHMLSVLQRTNFCGLPALPYRSEMMVTFDGKEYRLWAYSRNWPGHASFLAGILVGKIRLWEKVQRRLRRRKRVKAGV